MSMIVDRLRHPMWRSTTATMAETPPGLMMLDERQTIKDMNDAAQEIEKLEAAIKLAHYALTKSSLTADERVYDATGVLSRQLR